MNFLLHLERKRVHGNEETKSQPQIDSSLIVSDINFISSGLREELWKYDDYLWVSLRNVSESCVGQAIEPLVSSVVQKE